MGIEDILNAFQRAAQAQELDNRNYYENYAEDTLKVYNRSVIISAAIPLIILACLGTGFYYYCIEKSYILSQLSIILVTNLGIWPLWFFLKQLEFEIRQFSLWSIKKRQESFKIAKTKAGF